MPKAVFFDRDGVLNKALIRNGQPHSPEHLEEFEFSCGAAEALCSLKRAGFLLIVATNQPNVARRLQQQSDVEIIHEKLKSSLPLDDVRICYHDDYHHCSCRKPEPGLLLSAARDWEVRLSDSYMIGDRWKDMEAGRRAGCKTIFLEHSYNGNEPRIADYYANSILEAAKWILVQGNSSLAAGTDVRSHYGPKI